ncbi:MAG: aminodeoxychorismate synthase component I [Bacteroidales bacterium]|jgi:para-aminobenzoate synthetase component 1|nr:aminodeoxychorismate synthase component I [Bacteroidales bacterium]
MAGVPEVKEMMNRCGALRKPFLFGFDFELKNAFFANDPLTQDGILFRTSMASNYQVNDTHRGAAMAELITEGFISEEEYCRKFKIVHEAIVFGNSYLCNLTVTTPVRLNMSLREVFIQTRSLYGICYHNRFISFSPERFVLISNGEISSNPMKGTIDATLPDAEKRLTGDYKEECEHNTIVDLIRNDLGSVAERIIVRRFKYIDRIKTDRGELLQMSSEISGSLAGDYHSRLGDIIISMLPAGSVSGAPKPSTLKIIRQSEGEKRGFYTGVFGYYDGESLDSAVMIRFIEDTDEGTFYRSGGGITINSRCRDEWSEARHKIYLPLIRR